MRDHKFSLVGTDPQYEIELPDTWDCPECNSDMEMVEDGYKCLIDERHDIVSFEKVSEVLR